MAILQSAGRRFGIAPLPDGRVYWFATLSTPAHRPPRADLAAVRATFAGWHPDVGAVLDATVGEVSCLPIEELGPGRYAYARDGVVLLGDAAHAMTPNLGQGANQALEDAATLVDLIGASGGDVDRALSDYDRIRRPRTRAVADASRRIGRVAQLGHPVGTAARDALLRCVPAPLTDASALRLQRGYPG